MIVIKGAGKVFSAGGDVKEMLGYVEDGTDRAAYFCQPLSAFGRMILSIRETSKPVIAAVHGAVAGVAFNLVLACDLRIAEENTRFTQAFIKLGLSPDGGGTYFLPRLVGYARACELTMLHDGIDAQTAFDWGLINWIAPMNKLNEKVNEIAGKLAQSSTTGLSQTKALLRQAYDNSLEEHIEMERLVQVKNAASADFEEGLRAFVEKRKAIFGD